jgi:hypothetical protein
LVTQGSPELKGKRSNRCCYSIDVTAKVEGKSILKNVGLELTPSSESGWVNLKGNEFLVSFNTVLLLNGS